MTVYMTLYCGFIRTRRNRSVGTNLFHVVPLHQRSTCTAAAYDDDSLNGDINTR